MSSRKHVTTSLLLAVIVAVGSVELSYRASMMGSGLDYYQLWLVNRWLSAGGGPDIYGHDAQVRLGQYARDTTIATKPPGRERLAAETNQQFYGGRLEGYATPFLYACLAPLASGDYDADFRLMVLVNLGAYVGATLLLARRLGFGLDMAMLAVVALTPVFKPFFSHVGVMNVSAFHAAMLLAALACLVSDRMPARDAVAGAILGLAIAFKPTVAPAALAIGLVLAITRDARRALQLGIGGAAGLLLGWVVGCLYFGAWDQWQAWWADIHGMLESTRAFDPFNCSWMMRLRRVTGVDFSVPALGLMLATLAACAWRGRGRGRSASAAPGRRLALAASLGAAMALLASPYNWFHYYLLVAPLVLWTWRPVQRTGAERTWYRAASVVALVFLSVIVADLGPDGAADAWLGNLGVVILVALGLCDLARWGEHEAASLDEAAPVRAPAAPRAGRGRAVA